MILSLYFILSSSVFSVCEEHLKSQVTEPLGAVRIPIKKSAENLYCASEAVQITTRAVSKKPDKAIHRSIKKKALYTVKISG